MRIWMAICTAGTGFTVGFLCGLLIRLPVESMPTNAFSGNHLERVLKIAQVDVDLGRKHLELDKSYNVPINSMKIDTNPLQHKDLVNVDYVPFSNEDSSKIIKGIKLYNKPRSVTREQTNSVVYVNSDHQKLVLTNDSVIDISQVREELDADYRLDQHLLPNIRDAGFEDKAYAGAGDVVNKHYVVKHNYKIEIPNYRNGFLSSAKDVVEGVFWSNSVENYCPKGFDKDDYDKWKIKANNETYVSMTEGCGLMQNRLLTFSSSEKACARYRINTDQMQGEIYSYYLSKLLGINNVVPSVLQLANSNKDQWRVIAQDVAKAKWWEGKPVIVTQWIDGLYPAYIPVEFRNLSTVLHPKDVIERVRLQGVRLDNVNDGTSVCELFQWSDLIVFDYLTANLDRVVNNLFNLQWNDRMMRKPTHNLEKEPQGNLVFLDNESGLFHGYRLLDKYSSYHENLLNSLCVFRKQTIKSISHFATTDNIGDALQAIYEENEPLHRYLPRIPVANIKKLKSRMDAVLRQVDKCALENL